MLTISFASCGGLICGVKAVIVRFSHIPHCMSVISKHNNGFQI